jgi:hypothetical protein
MNNGRYKQNGLMLIRLLTHALSSKEEERKPTPLASCSL